jgi:signal transduction histidine kinase
MAVRESRVTLRGILYAGFGVIFLMWVVSGYDLVRRLGVIEDRTGEVAARFVWADRQLSTVRIQILLSAIYVRDAIFDTTPNVGSFYREQLEGARRDVDRAMAAYVPVDEAPAGRLAFESLRSEVDDFWKTVQPIMSSDVDRRSAEAKALVREHLIPKREVIIRISERIKEINRLTVEEQQAEVGRIYQAMRWRIWEASGLAVLAGLAIAWFVTRYAGALEARIREQSAADAQNTRDLQRLSARLVTAQEEERRAIARELHDEIGQALTAIKVELAVVGRHAELTGKASTAFQEARSLTERGLHQARDLSQLLHPAMLDDLGLPATIAWYLDGFAARTGVRTDLVQERMDDRLAAEIETCIYRIVQEALTNVARHAEASVCRVYLHRQPDAVRLVVEDNGKGFVPGNRGAGHPRTGLGLLGIEERVSGFRGTLRVESAPGRGTRLAVELPGLPRRPEVPAGDGTSSPTA